ncbi:MAG TPA: glycosyltransferase family 39 protein, partial [Ktedonobacterales bacterium]|nr:glycosyltransferase family 39 protein [Ktedonobacterales bacterium]
LDATDGAVVARTAQAIVFEHKLSVPPDTFGAVVGAGGRSYSKYGIAQSLAEIPLAIIGKALTHVTGLELTSWSISWTNVFVTALGCALFYLLVRALGAGERRAIALTLLYGLCSLAWPYAKTDFNEPLQATALLAAAYALQRARGKQPGWLLLGGTALAIAVLTKAVLLAVVAPVFAIYAALTLLDTGGRPFAELSTRLRERQWWLALLRQQPLLWAPIVGAVVITLLLNMARFGSPLDFGYGRTPDDKPFSGSILVGLYGLILSPNASLLFYATPVVLGVIGFRRFARRQPAEAALVALLAASLLIFYGGYLYWPGLSAFGPRYLVPLVPFLLLPAIDAFPNVLSQPRAALVPLGILGVVAFLGVFEQMLGVVVCFRLYTALTCTQFPCRWTLDPTQAEGLYHVWLLGPALAYNFLGHVPSIQLRAYPFGTAPPGRPGWQHLMVDEMRYFWFDALPHTRLWLIAGLTSVGIPTCICFIALMRRMRASPVTSQAPLELATTPARV